jgi:hypothetical protein
MASHTNEDCDGDDDANQDVGIMDLIDYTLVPPSNTHDDYGND